MKRIFTLVSHCVLKPGESLDISFVPPLVRRRFSPLQKIFFALANAVEKSPAGCSVFSSCTGEVTLTRRIVDEFHEDGSVSPHRFSSSVYNAAPGLWSVFTKNKAPYTAVAAGDDSIECGLIEMLATEKTGLFVYAEETDGGYGASFFLDDGLPGRRLEVTAGDASRTPVSFSRFVDFLSGGTSVLEGRWITIRDVTCEG
jgi:hypothetical protein